MTNVKATLGWNGDQLDLSNGTQGALLVPSVRQLLVAFRSGDQTAYREVKSAYERRAGGKLAEEFYADNIDAAAVLIQIKRRYKIRMEYNSGQAPPEFAATLRAARLEERRSSALLNGTSQRIFAQTIYMIIVHMLAVWDSIKAPGYDGDVETRLAKELEAAEKDLEETQPMVNAAARDSALTWYLWGLPIGVLLGIGIVVVVVTLPFAVASSAEISFNRQLGFSFAFGAIGAIVSVMVRVTKGPEVRIAKEQGRLITMVAGAFRPVIGAVFGAILYVLILAGLIPLKAGEDVDPGLFFAGLAFLAGFSERWAQDAILHSTPATVTPPVEQPAARGTTTS